MTLQPTGTTDGLEKILEEGPVDAIVEDVPEDRPAVRAGDVLARALVPPGGAAALPHPLHRSTKPKPVGRHRSQLLSGQNRSQLLAL